MFSQIFGDYFTIFLSWKKCTRWFCLQFSNLKYTYFLFDLKSACRDILEKHAYIKRGK